MMMESMVTESRVPGCDETVWERVPLFGGLSVADREAITERLTLRPVTAGERLIRQGVWSGTLFILRTGIVEISLEAADGERPLRRLVSGECFGEMSLITGAPPSATVRALTDGEVWTLSHQDFRQLAVAQPALSRNVSAILSERLAHASRQRVDLEPEQVLVVVGASAELIRALATALARLSGKATLLVDLVGGTGGEEGGDTAFTLGDLLHGRRRGVGTPATADGALTVVRGLDARREGGAAGPHSLDLPAALGRLGGDFRYLLVALPFEHPLLTPQLLAYATRTLVAGSAAALPALRTRLAALPTPTRARTHLHALLTEAPAKLRPTVATLELLSDELGVPVRAIVPADAGDAAAAIAALARWLVGRRIGLALGAGGAKGYAHLGVLRALRRLEIPFDCVTGASMGAIVGAAIAMEASTAWIEAAFQAGPSRVFRPTLPFHSLLSSRALSAWLQELGGHRLVEELPIPFAVSAADLNEGCEIVVRRGPLWQALLASAAIPGIYPPVRIDRRWLVDGGVVNPVPVSTARLLGADVTIAVDLSVPISPCHTLGLDCAVHRRPPTLRSTIVRSQNIMMSEIRARTAGEPSVLIKPQVMGIALRNFGRGSRFVEAGEAAVEAALPRLREHLPWLGAGISATGAS